MSEMLFHPDYVLAFASQRRDELAGERLRASFVHFGLRRRATRRDRVAEAHLASLRMDPRESAMLATAR
ncbi:MAG: hypothetical protein LC118_13980 [Dehalococcoidia bacterium]|nr:hypothetical protein [Dehalococcoidia bacterium]